MKLKLFHDAKAPLANGHKRDSLLMMSDEEFESNHGFIQWAFPTAEKSNHNFNAPVLDLDSAIWLAKRNDVSEFLENMSVRFLEFLKRNDHWKSRYNHNHLRISRAIDSLRLLHSWELADWFYAQVKAFAGQSLELMSDASAHWEAKASAKHDRVAGAFVGLAVGDALGAPVEFCRRGTFKEVTEYRAGGKFDLPAGAWTDDTAMALCLAQSLIEEDGFNAEDLLKRFSRWLEKGENTSTGESVGVGQNTLRTLGDFWRKGTLVAERFGSKNEGNGSLMRLAPVVCCYYHDLQKVREIASAQSRTTHASDIADECCQYLAGLMARVIGGQSYENARSELQEAEWGYPLMAIIENNHKTAAENEIKSSGYVIDTLNAAIWAVENSQSFEGAVLKAVNLGDDADTVGAVAGQIAGAIYGYSSVPKHLKAGLVDERKLYVTSQFLTI
jgi:ADP-ribosyl-[dinitrogen reductase] hydrolase